MKQPKKERKQFVLGVDSKSIKRESIQQEQKVAKEFSIKGTKAILTPGSGNKKGMPGDIYFKNKLIDLKSTKSGQVIVTAEMLEKVYSESLQQGKEPVLILNFIDKNLPLRIKRWAVIPEGDMC